MNHEESSGALCDSKSSIIGMNWNRIYSYFACPELLFINHNHSLITDCGGAPGACSVRTCVPGVEDS